MHVGPPDNEVRRKGEIGRTTCFGLIPHGPSSARKPFRTTLQPRRRVQHRPSLCLDPCLAPLGPMRSPAVAYVTLESQDLRKVAQRSSGSTSAPGVAEHCSPFWPCSQVPQQRCWSSFGALFKNVRAACRTIGAPPKTCLSTEFFMSPSANV